MKLIGDFLSRFKNLTPPSDSLRRAVARAVFDVAGVSVEKSDVFVAHGIAYVKCSSVAKSTIRVSRAGILQHIFENVPSARGSLRDVR